MKDSEADIAIGVLNKLIDQELEAVRAATRDGNTPFGGYAQTRHNAFLYAKDEISKALAGIQTLSGSEDIQISHALTMATIQASKALKQAHLMQDTADMLDQADQRDEENKISRMLMHKIAQQGE